MEFVNKATGLSLHIPKREVKMNVCSIWPFAQISDDFYYLGFGNVPDICSSIIQGLCFNYHQRNVRSRVSVSAFMTNHGLVSKFKPGLGLGLGGYGHDYITDRHFSSEATFS